MEGGIETARKRGWAAIDEVIPRETSQPRDKERYKKTERLERGIHTTYTHTVQAQAHNTHTCTLR